MHMTRADDDGIPTSVEAPDPVSTPIAVLNGNMGTLSNIIEEVMRMLKQSPHSPAAYFEERLVRAKQSVEGVLQKLDAGRFHGSYIRATELLKSADGALANIRGRRAKHSPSSEAM
jgi:hypothetical protein